MAEEGSGLSYTIRFIPDTTEIDKSIKEIASQVKREVQDAINQARGAAGIDGDTTTTGVGEQPSIMDRVLSEFKSVKERINATLQEIGILSGRSRALGHSTSKTLGDVTERAAKKLQSADIEQMSTDQILQFLMGATVTGGRILAGKELAPTDSITDIVERHMQDQVGSLKGISDALLGVGEHKSVKALDSILRLAEVYDRTVSATGKSRVKGIEQGVMESVGHDVIEQVGKSVVGTEGDWDTSEITFTDLYKSFGMGEAQARAVPGAGFKVADFIKLVGDTFEVFEWKTVGEIGGATQFRQVMDWLNVFLTELNVSPSMQKKFSEITGEPFPEGGVRGMGEMVAGAPRGSVEKVIGGIPLGEFIDSIDFRNIGDQVREVLSQTFSARLPDLQQDLESLLSEMAPGPARAHVRYLLEIIEKGLQVLQARSLPDFWMQIGVDVWIQKSAVAYVDTLTREIKPLLGAALGLYVGGETEGVIDADVEPVSGSLDSERILQILLSIDDKIDGALRGESSATTQPPEGTLLGNAEKVIGRSG